MTAQKLIDDQNYAECFVRTNVRVNDYGPAKIKQKLLKKGISTEIIEDALTKNFTYDQQLDLAQRGAFKAFGTNRKRSHKECLSKMKIKLKGFQEDIINTVIEDFKLINDPETEKDKLVKNGEKIINRLNQDLSEYQKKAKVKQSLFNKGFELNQIENFLNEMNF